MDNNKIQFEDWHPPQRQPEQTKIAKGLMKLSGGRIKSQKQADVILAIMLAAIVIATILVLTLGGPKSPGTATPAENFTPPAGEF